MNTQELQPRNAIDFLRDQYDIDWNPIQHRIRCQGHVINLAVQAFMFGRNPEAVDEAVRQVEAGEETEVDVALVEQLKKGGRNSWRRIGPWVNSTILLSISAPILVAIEPFKSLLVGSWA